MYASVNDHGLDVDEREDGHEGDCGAGDDDADGGVGGVGAGGEGMRMDVDGDDGLDGLGDSGWDAEMMGDEFVAVN